MLAGLQDPAVASLAATTYQNMKAGKVAGAVEKRRGSIAFNNKSVRLGFIKKVFAILSVQLAIILGINAVFLIPSVLDFSIKHQWLSILVGLVAAATLFMVGEMHRKAPANIFLIAVITLVEAFMIASITSHFGYLYQVMIFTDFKKRETLKAP